jgi:hypothetical protein
MLIDPRFTFSKASTSISRSYDTWILWKDHRRPLWAIVEHIPGYMVYLRFNISHVEPPVLEALAILSTRCPLVEMDWRAIGSRLYTYLGTRGVEYGSTFSIWYILLEFHGYIVSLVYKGVVFHMPWRHPTHRYVLCNRYTSYYRVGTSPTLPSYTILCIHPKSNMLIDPRFTSSKASISRFRSPSLYWVQKGRIR